MDRGRLVGQRLARLMYADCMSAPAISKPVLTFFRRIVRSYLQRHFHGVRVRGINRVVEAGANETPLVLYANHGSWWDPMVAIFLAEKLMSERNHYAPMDAEALKRYGILRRVGIFPVEMKSARGAVQFLRTSRSIVGAGGVLWVTPQGQFVDARARPLDFKPGLAALAVKVASSVGQCTVLPLAIEYPFWDERLPECLISFGDAVKVSTFEEVEAVQVRLIASLEAAMDELKVWALRRDAAGFTELAKGRSGVGGMYEVGQRIKAIVLRQPYKAEHASLAIPAESEVREGKPPGA